MSKLIRYNYPLSSVFDEMEKNFNNFLSYPASGNKDFWLPDVDIKEDGDVYTVKMDVPGMDKKNIKINIDKYNNLIVEGERDSEIKQNKKDYICFERYKGSFYRKFTLPGTVNSQGIKATYRDGVLDIKIPKAKEEVTKQINIEE